MIYQDNGQGRAFRRRVVGGQLSEEDISTIPRCFHRMPKYSERKQAVGGSKVTVEDYNEAGLMQPISRQRWVQFWARARAGKSGGESELHATLIKAAVKKVFDGGGTIWQAKEGSENGSCSGRVEAAGECCKSGEVLLQ